MANPPVGGTLGTLGALAVSPASLGHPLILLAEDVDPATRDLRSLFTGVDPIDAQVQVALDRVRGSGAAVVEDGMAAPPDKMLDSLAADLEREARVALSRLVRNGDVRVKRCTVLVDPGHQTAQIIVEYFNLRLDATGVRQALVSVPSSDEV